MIAKNVTLDDLESALAKANEKFSGNLRWNRYPEKAGRGYRFTLRVSDSKGPGARLGFSGRHMTSACWHAHGTFFDALPREAVVKAGELTIRPGDMWQDRNIGSMMQPLYYSEACEC